MEPTVPTPPDPAPAKSTPPSDSNAARNIGASLTNAEEAVATFIVAAIVFVSRLTGITHIVTYSVIAFIVAINSGLVPAAKHLLSILKTVPSNLFDAFRGHTASDPAPTPTLSRYSLINAGEARCSPPPLKIAGDSVQVSAPAFSPQKLVQPPTLLRLLRTLCAPPVEVLGARGQFELLTIQ